MVALPSQIPVQQTTATAAKNGMRFQQKAHSVVHPGDFVPKDMPMHVDPNRLEAFVPTMRDAETDQVVFDAWVDGQSLQSGLNWGSQAEAENPGFESGQTGHENTAQFDMTWGVVPGAWDANHSQMQQATWDGNLIGCSMPGQGVQEVDRLQSVPNDHSLASEVRPAVTTKEVHVGGWPVATPMAECNGAVAADEYQRMQQKCLAGEERIKELEQYIKDQSVKQALCGESQLRQKDEEIDRLRRAVTATTVEAKQATAELQSLRVQYQQIVHGWEQGARHLLATAEKFLEQPRSAQKGSDAKRLEDSHFGQTAMKISLTLDSNTDEESANDVGSLQRLLCNALSPANTNGAHNKEKVVSCKKAVQKTVALAVAAPPECEEPAASQVGPDEHESAYSMPPHMALAGWQASVSNSITTSLGDTSPHQVSSRCPLVGKNGTKPDPLICQSSTRPEERSCTFLDVSGPNSGAFQFLTMLVAEIRQLLGHSQQQAAALAKGCAGLPAFPLPSSLQCPGLNSVEASPGTHASLASSSAENIGPMRKCVAQSVIAAEKMLRSLVRDLRCRCEELLGRSELEQAPDAADDTACNLVIEREARSMLPVQEEAQLVGISALRRAQMQSSALLVQFIELPQKLKAFFDLTKRLAEEAEGNAMVAKVSEQRHACHLEMLQQQLNALSVRLSGVHGVAAGSAGVIGDAASDKSLGAEDDLGAGAQETAGSVPQGGSPEEQLAAMRVALRRREWEVSLQDKLLRDFQQDVAGLQMACCREAAQYLSLMQQPVAPPGAWPQLTAALTQSQPASPLL